CRGRNGEICVLQVNAAVLDENGVIVTDRNAASGWRRFLPVASGLSVVSRERVFARYWLHPDDPYDEMSHKSEKCAEVLVPDRVDAQFIVGAYVANQVALTEFQRVNSQCCTKVIMSGVNGKVIMSGYGDDNPDDERREAARGYTKSIYEEGRGTASSFNPCPLNPIKIDIRRAYRILSTQTAIG